MDLDEIENYIHKSMSQNSEYCKQAEIYFYEVRHIIHIIKYYLLFTTN